MAGQGMPAKFDGVCPACGADFYVGEMIEKIPQHGDKRGHLGCYQRLNPQGARAAQPHQAPPAQAQAPASVTQHPSSRPATAGPRAAAQDVTLDDETLRDLWKLKDAFTEAAQGNMKAAVCVESILKRVDPHQAKAVTRTDEPARRVS